MVGAGLKSQDRWKMELEKGNSKQSQQNMYDHNNIEMYGLYRKFGDTDRKIEKKEMMGLKEYYRTSLASDSKEGMAQ